MTVGGRWWNGNNTPHAAADYSVSIGTPVFAVRNGTILDFNDGEKDHEADGLEHGIGEDGNWILLGTTYKDRDASILYLHLTKGFSSDPDRFRRGMPVVAGQQLANSGNSGHTFGPHLHVAAMFGHRSAGDRFAYLSNLSKDNPADGTASNGIAIYPPGHLYSRSGPSPFGSGKVFVNQLSFGVMDSDSVRRLQTRMNRLRLEGGEKLPVTGNFLEMTRAEVIKWQIQRDGKEPGTELASGQLNLAQARRLFPDRYTVRAGT